MDMAWEKVKITLFEGSQKEIDNVKCPECGGKIKSSFGKETGSYTIQCQKCWVTIRGIYSKYPE